MRSGIQLNVLRRKVRGRVQLTNSDRLFLIRLYRWFPSVLKAITIIRPETLVRWHRAGLPSARPFMSSDLSTALVALVFARRGKSWQSNSRPFAIREPQ